VNLTIPFSAEMLYLHFHQCLRGMHKDNFTFLLYFPFDATLCMLEALSQINKIDHKTAVIISLQAALADFK
jgi:hypothetical protein